MLGIHTESAKQMACSYFVNILCMAVLLLIAACEHGIIAHGDGRFPGGARGLQSRCEARRTSWVCSIRTHLRHKQLARSVCGLFCVVVKLTGTRASSVLHPTPPAPASVPLPRRQHLRPYRYHVTSACVRSATTPHCRPRAASRFRIAALSHCRKRSNYAH